MTDEHHPQWGGPPGPQPTPWSASSSQLRALTHQGHYSCVTAYRRRLPHIFELQQPVFVTWRLHGSLPSNRPFPSGTLTSGEAFAAMDRLLDEARTYPLYLRQPALADMVPEAILCNGGEVLGHYSLHAFAVMPNHVHLLITPVIPLPRVMKSLKGITAKRANAMLALTGEPFWQDESYDRLVRNDREFERIRSYIVGNPMRAGLVHQDSLYRWLSAGWATGGSPADQGVRPTTP